MTPTTITTAPPGPGRQRRGHDEQADPADAPLTLGQMFLDSAARHPGIALQFTRGGLPAYISYLELGTLSSEIARGLISLGIEAGDRVAILGLTSAEWTLVYTSGTTGPPKGCMLIHENILATARMYVEQLHFNETHSLYQFLPLAHVLARVAQAVALSCGARIIYWSGDASKIADELASTKPTHFPAVPRIFEKMHGVVSGRVADGPASERALFRWALQCGARAADAA